MSKWSFTAVAFVYVLDSIVGSIDQI